MVCKFCNSTSIKVKRDIRSPHNGEYYHLYHCLECKSYFFDDLCSDAILEKLSSIIPTSGLLVLHIPIYDSLKRFFLGLLSVFDHIYSYYEFRD